MQGIKEIKAKNTKLKGEPNKINWKQDYEDINIARIEINHSLYKWHSNGDIDIDIETILKGKSAVILVEVQHNFNVSFLSANHLS